MRPDFTKYLPHILDRAIRELPEGPLSPRILNDFWKTNDSQLKEWLGSVEVLSYHVFPDGSISLNFTGREFINWLRTQEKEYSEKYV